MIFERVMTYIKLRRLIGPSLRKYLHQKREREAKLHAVRLLQRICRGALVHKRIKLDLRIERLNRTLAHFAEIRKHREESAAIMINYYVRKFIKKVGDRKRRELREAILAVEFRRKVKLVQKTWRMCK